MSLILWRAWRLWRTNPLLFYRRVGSFLRSPVQNSVALVNAPRRSKRIQTSYRHWVTCQQADRGEHTAGSRESRLISILMPVYNVDEDLLDAAIRSVVNQTYPLWELCIADDASSVSHVRSTLERYARMDARVRVTYRSRQGHIAEASNTALAEARGEFVVLLDHDDVLSPDALSEIAHVLEDNPNVDLIYSDEDKIDLDGEHVEPFFKPAWSPTLLQSCNYITHLSALRRSLVVEVGGFRHDTVGSQDHDLFLRVTERARGVAHVPRVLYSWRKSATSTAATSTAKPYAIEATHRALRDSVERQSVDVTIEPSHLNGLFYTRRRIPKPVRVSLIIVGHGESWRSLLTHHALEIQDVTYLDRHIAASAEILSGSHDGVTVGELRGEHVLWMDAGAAPSNPDSVIALFEHLQDDKAGVVGGRTVRRRSGAILQAGLVIDDVGQPAYAHAGLLPVPQPVFYLNLKDLPHEVSAVHVGCCAIKRDRWKELCGWNETLPASLAMVDLCLRCLQQGYNNIYTPLATFECRQSLGMLPSIDGYDWAWHDYRDPFWNPNLTVGTRDGLPFRCHGNRHACVRECGALLPRHGGE